MMYLLIRIQEKNILLKAKKVKISSDFSNKNKKSFRRGGRILEQRYIGQD